MKLLISLLILSGLITAGCTSALKGHRNVASDLSSQQQTENDLINKDIEDFISLSEESYVWRAAALKLFRVYKEKNTLGSDDMSLMYSQAEYYLTLRERIYTIINKYNREVFSLDRSLNFASKDDLIYMKKVKLSLAAGLVLYDNYLVGIYPYYENKKLRRLLRRDRPALEGQLDELMKNFIDEDNRDKLAYGITTYIQENNSSLYQPLDSQDRYLNEAVKQSPSFNHLRKDVDDGIRSGKVRYGFTRVRDALKTVGRSFTFVTSKLFGNAVGLVETRDGYLKSMSRVDRRAIEFTLKPLDVLMEKTPFRLTDKFIPGHYGHVAVWVGTENELREIGVWDHPAVAKYHKEIRLGYAVLEALRPGVQINTLQQFLNIDDLLVVRHTSLTDEQRRRYLIKAFEQVGKEYDFNFDVETDKRIVCSELAYVVFEDMKWPTEKSLGRYTISPDNVAVKAVDRNPFTPVIMYHEGKKIENNQVQVLRRLLGEAAAAGNR